MTRNVSGRITRSEAVADRLGALLLALTIARPFAVQPTPRLALELQDYAALPITADNTDANTRAQLARVNYLRDEPGGRRFFVNDLNGPLYILDKQTKTFTKYLDFNGLAGRPGLFPKFTYARNFATGLTNVILDPDYARNGVFYTLHMEDPSTPGPAEPRSGVVPGLDLSGYTTTPAVTTPTVDGRIDREVVLVEWKDRNVANATFEGTARELLRVQHPLAPHPLGEMTFNPVARPGDPDWRVMYLGAGDAQSGEQRDSRRLNPQRLDTLVGKILRIIPDLREHTKTSTVSENGRYRIPNDNPFATVDGARKEIWAYGLRNPHRLAWDVDPARPRTATLLAFNIGLVTWETVVVIHKGANYGYPLREGTQSMSSTNGMGPLPENDTIPVQISDTVARGTVKPTYPVIQYPHNRETAATPSPTASSTAANWSRRSRTSSSSATSPPVGSGTPIVPTCSRPTTTTRRPSHRSTRSRPACVDSPKRRTARAAAKEKRSPAWERGLVAAASTFDSPSTTTASSTS